MYKKKGLIKQNNKLFKTLTDGHRTKREDMMENEVLS
jgi:hypothetical protein